MSVKSNVNKYYSLSDMSYDMNKKTSVLILK